MTSSGILDFLKEKLFSRKDVSFCIIQTPGGSSGGRGSIDHLVVAGRTAAWSETHRQGFSQDSWDVTQDQLRLILMKSRHNAVARAGQRQYRVDRFDPGNLWEACTATRGLQECRKKLHLGQEAKNK